MSDDVNVLGNAEWLLKNGLLDCLKNNLDLIGQTTNIRGRGNVDTAKSKATGAIAVAVNARQTVKDTNEYECATRIIIETDAATDTTGEVIDGLVGIVRDIIHLGAGEAGAGPSVIVETLNELMRGFVIHADGFEETTTEPDDDLRSDTKRRVMNLVVTGYVGYASE